ncbi:MAG: hypothetical protein ACREFQ_06695, partial [Stellaceae bacterium]
DMRIVLAALVLAFGGCAAAPQPGGGGSGGGAAALTAVGTPFLVALKLPVCVLTLAAAGPVGALSEIAEPQTQFGRDLRQGLGDGIAQNCGPPYAVTP